MSEVENHAPPRRHIPARTVIAVFVVLGILTVDWFGELAILQSIFLLATGWFRYPLRTFDQLTFEWTSITVAIVAAILFTWGLHRSLSQWRTNRSAANPATRWPLRKSAAVSTGILFAFVAGISMIGIVHQLIWISTSEEHWLSVGREPRPSLMSMNHLKVQGLGFSMYREANSRFPPGNTFDPSGNKLHSWQTLLLPYIDEQELAEQIDLSVPWSAEPNSTLFQTRIAVFENPRIDMAVPNRSSFAISHYAGNSRLLTPRTGMPLSKVVDGTSNTFIGGEVGSGFKPWGDPSNLRDPALGLRVSPTTFGLSEDKKTALLFADGHIQFFEFTTDRQILKALATPDGGEEFSYP